MKTRIIARRSRVTGVARYEEVADVTGIVAVARALASTGRPDAMATKLVAWADGLGHAPTAAEFQAWYVEHGGVVVDVTDESECAN